MEKLVTNNCKNEIIKYLINEKSDRVDKNILKSEVVVIDRLLENELLAIDFYEEIGAKLTTEQWESLISQVLSLAAFWNPEAITEMKNAKKGLQSINNEISLVAENLSKLLKKRREISDAGFDAYDCYHIVELIDRASLNNGLYQNYVKEKLVRLRRQFSLKYWPEIEDIIQELSYDASTSQVEAVDNISIAATSSSKTSITDFFRVIYEGFEEMKYSNYGPLPNDFSLSDKATASMVNSILPLSEEHMVEPPYVKRLRQRLRD